MKSSNADIMCSHMEVDGFEVTPGMHFDGGFSVSDFKNFDRVWSGPVSYTHLTLPTT